MAIVESLENTPIEDYAARLFENWGIGGAGQHNGVLFLVAISDRQMRIEVGYGLEGALTDLHSKQILDDIVRPALRAGDFEGGIKLAVEAIVKTLENEPIPRDLTTSVRRELWNNDLAGMLIWLALIGSSYFFSVAGRSKSFWAGGIWGGALGTTIGILAASLLIWFFAAALLGVAGLLFDYLVSKAYRQAKLARRSPPWWAGGQSPLWSGFDSRSGSFGGFGGGLSGGGGSSSSW